MPAQPLWCQSFGKKHAGPLGGGPTGVFAGDEEPSSPLALVGETSLSEISIGFSEVLSDAWVEENMLPSPNLGGFTEGENFMSIFSVLWLRSGVLAKGLGRSPVPQRKL